MAEGDRVVARWTLVGDHERTFMGIPASGNRVKVGGIIIYRLSGGKIAKYWGATDRLALMRQIEGGATSLRSTDRQGPGTTSGEHS